MKFLVAALIASAVSLSVLAGPKVVLETSLGNITLELNEKEAPVSTANFLAYVHNGFYKGTVFHRVIDGFMIQGGGFEPGMAQKTPGAPIQNEAKNGLKNRAGAIAMARTQDPHSATAQFFINLVDNDKLDYPSFDGWGYAVFGEVVDGMDVVRKIGKTATGQQGFHRDVPVSDITILDAREIPGN